MTLSHFHELVEAVICRELNGLMTPLDRTGKRNMVNFVDHRSSYSRSSLRGQGPCWADFWAVSDFFRVRFSCKVYISRTDGGGEYRNVEIFCKWTGVIGQVSVAIPKRQTERLNACIVLCQIWPNSCCSQVASCYISGVRHCSTPRICKIAARAASLHIEHLSFRYRRVRKPAFPILGFLKVHAQCITIREQ